MRAQPLVHLNRELLDEAYKAFRPTPITPGMDRDRIMFDAGALKALEWLDKRLAQKSESAVMSPEEEAELPDSNEGAWRRALKGRT